jgi:hypothetical protein
VFQQYHQKKLRIWRSFALVVDPQGTGNQWMRNCFQPTSHEGFSSTLYLQSRSGERHIARTEQNFRKCGANCLGLSQYPLYVLTLAWLLFLFILSLYLCPQLAARGSSWNVQNRLNQHHQNQKSLKCLACLRFWLIATFSRTMEGYRQWSTYCTAVAAETTASAWVSERLYLIH